MLELSGPLSVHGKASFRRSTGYTTVLRRFRTCTFKAEIQADAAKLLYAVLRAFACKGQPILASPRRFRSRSLSPKACPSTVYHNSGSYFAKQPLRRLQRLQRNNTNRCWQLGDALLICMASRPPSFRRCVSLVEAFLLQHCQLVTSHRILRCDLRFLLEPGPRGSWEAVALFEAL